MYGRGLFLLGMMNAGADVDPPGCVIAAVAAGPVALGGLVGATLLVLGGAVVDT
jgi:hypothetical protein